MELGSPCPMPLSMAMGSDVNPSKARHVWQSWSMARKKLMILTGLGKDRGKPLGVHNPTHTRTPEGYVPLPRGKGYVRGMLGTPGYVGTRTNTFQNSARGWGPGEGRGVWVHVGMGGSMSAWIGTHRWVPLGRGYGVREPCGLVARRQSVVQGPGPEAAVLPVDRPREAHRAAAKTHGVAGCCVRERRRHGEGGGSSMERAVVVARRGQRQWHVEGGRTVVDDVGGASAWASRGCEVHTVAARVGTCREGRGACGMR